MVSGENEKTWVLEGDTFKTKPDIDRAGGARALRPRAVLSHDVWDLTLRPGGAGGADLPRPHLRDGRAPEGRHRRRWRSGGQLLRFAPELSTWTARLLPWAELGVGGLAAVGAGALLPDCGGREPRFALCASRRRLAVNLRRGRTDIDCGCGRSSILRPAAGLGPGRPQPGPRPGRVDELRGRGPPPVRRRGGRRPWSAGAASTSSTSCSTRSPRSPPTTFPRPRQRTPP